MMEKEGMSKDHRKDVAILALTYLMLGIHEVVDPMGMRPPVLGILWFLLCLIACFRAYRG